MRSADLPSGVQRLKLILSDLHIGEGQRRGTLNPWENFRHDDKLAELLTYYSTDYHEDDEVELIVLGDFFDLLQVRYQGEFPDVITEEIARAKIDACLEGHPVVVDAFRRFLEKPRKRVTYVPGNHDIDFVFPSVRAAFARAVTGKDESDLVRFVLESPWYRTDGVLLHHGHQLEAMNRFNYRQFFDENGGAGTKALRLPWGSIFTLRVLNRMKEARPYVDRVQPFSLYLLGALLFDTRFALRLCWHATVEFIRMRWRELKRGKAASVLRTLKILLEFSAFPSFESQARHLLERNRHVHALVMGHTHLARVRRFGTKLGDKIYVNTGTWTDLISLDLARFGQETKHYFALIEYRDDKPIVTLKEWLGFRALMRDIPF